MDAHPALHPTDQTLSSYGLGKLDDASAEAVNEHLEQCADCRKRVAEMSADSFLERVRDAQKPSGKSTSRPVASRRDAERQGDERLVTASGRHAAAGPGRPPRLRDQARARPGRHGRGLPGPQQADGPRRGAQGDGPAHHGTPRRARTLPPRDPGRRQAPAPEHRHGLLTPLGSARASSSRWSTSRVSTCPGWSRPRGRCRWPTPASSSTRRPSGSSTPTRKGWSTATSSRAT